MPLARILTRRKLALLACALILAAFALFGFHFAGIGYAQCHPARSLVTEAERARARETLPGLQEVTFPGQGGVELRGWFAPPKNGIVVVLVHGLYANRALLLPEAEVMARHGYGVLLYDSRAHGESGGSAATWGSSEAYDIGEAIRFVRARPGVLQVALLGFSVGASAVSRAAANDSTIGAVVLYATWTSLREEMAYKMARGGWLGAQFCLLGMRLSGTQVDQIEPEADLARIAPRPILFLSGGVDADTPPAIMDRMFAAASPPKEIWRAPTVGHGGYVEADPVEYERRVIGFLDRAFK